jgi:hypothetical protein
MDFYCMSIVEVQKLQDVDVSKCGLYSDCCETS